MQIYDNIQLVERSMRHNSIKKWKDSAKTKAAKESISPTRNNKCSYKSNCKERDKKILKNIGDIKIRYNHFIHITHL